MEIHKSTCFINWGDNTPLNITNSFSLYFIFNLELYELYNPICIFDKKNRKLYVLVPIFHDFSFFLAEQYAPKFITIIC